MDVDRIQRRCDCFSWKNASQLEAGCSLSIVEGCKRSHYFTGSEVKFFLGLPKWWEGCVFWVRTCCFRKHRMQLGAGSRDCCAGDRYILRPSFTGGKPLGVVRLWIPARRAVTNGLTRRGSGSSQNAGRRCSLRRFRAAFALSIAPYSEITAVVGIVDVVDAAFSTWHAGSWN